MKIHQINEHRIAVPADMQVHKASKKVHGDAIARTATLIAPPATATPPSKSSREYAANL